VPSKYDITLAFDSDERVAGFEVGAGELILLPALLGEISLDERGCSRRGVVTGFYVPHVLSHNPEDFEYLEWYCPVERLVLSIVPGSLGELKARAGHKRLPPELLDKGEARKPFLGEYFQKAEKVDRKSGGLTEYVFPGP
jgi:hypothetical protein